MMAHPMLPLTTIRRFAPLFLLLAALLPGSAAAAEPFSFATTPGLLPKTAAPLHYMVELVPDIDAATFAGQVTIDIEVREPTRASCSNRRESANARSANSARASSSFARVASFNSRRAGSSASRTS